jgi:peptidyl-prolyl cis-trans isomerase A (cyclophilin A)
MIKRQIYLLLFCIFLSSCSHSVFKAKWVKINAPVHYKARFETSKGNFEIEATREWSPKAADRLYVLLTHHFYDHLIIYRVVPNFVAQFGNTDTLVTKAWEKFPVADEPVLHSNLKGYIAYARAGKETRGNDLFINLKDNTRLDTINYNGVKGFPVFAKVTKGMEVVEALYSGYSNEPLMKLDSVKSNPKMFLNVHYPKLDSIRRAYILK